MWLPRAAFDRLMTERTTAVEAARVLSEEVATLRVTEDWLRLRVEQIERERAQLLFTYMGIKVQVPIVVKAEASDEELLSAKSPFVDMGDDLAKKLGIDWQADGTVRQ